MLLLRFLLVAILTAASASAEPRRLLLIGQGPDGHPPGTHEFMAGVRAIQALLRPHAAELEVTIAKADEPWPEGPALIDHADGIVLLVTQGARWMQSDPARHAALQRLAGRKGAIIALHWSVGAKDAQYIAGQLALLGGTRGGPQRKYIVKENDVALAETGHPILRGLAPFRINDEFYYRLDLQPPSPQFHPLLTTHLDGKDETICWAWERPNGGRSFGFVCLHFHENWKRVEYQRLVTQAILWTLNLPIADEGVTLPKLEPEDLDLPAPVR